MSKQSIYLSGALVAALVLGSAADAVTIHADAEPGSSNQVAKVPSFSYWIYDHKSELCDHGSELCDVDPDVSNALPSTVQLVTAQEYNVTYDKGTDTYRFSFMTMNRYQMDSDNTRKLCEGIWPRFREQPMLKGRSGILLDDGTILTSAHGGADLDTMYVIINRTGDSEQFPIEDGRVTIPGRYVRRPECILEDAHTFESDWSRLQLKGKREGPWSKGLKLAQRVESGQALAASFHPFGLPAKVTEKAEVRVQDSIYTIQIDSAEGCSGGALIDERGDLAGIVKGSLSTVIDWVEKFREIGVLDASVCIPARRYRPVRFTPVQSIVFNQDPTPGCPKQRPSTSQEEQAHAYPSQH